MPTINKNLEILNQTYVCYPLYSFSKNLGNELKKSKKYYLYDLGIRNMLLKNFNPMTKRKGNTILNFCNEALHKNLNDMILYIVDSSQMKQEKLTPGTQIRVVSPEYAQQVMPDIYLILAWNFANDIIRRETVFTDVGGKFIIANPYIPVDLDLECFVERF